jgi:sister chromatid cohesion protein DCC1
LETHAASDEGVLTGRFQDLWLDALPEAWRSEAKLERLRNLFVEPTPSTIKFNDPEAKEKTSSGTTAAKPGANRKWHEKFKNMRR